MAEHYKSQHVRKASKSKVIVIIAVILLLVTALGAGAYLLINYVIAPNTVQAEPPATEAPTAAVTEAPTAAPTQAPPTEPQAVVNAKNYLAGMSDREKICQLFIVTPEALTGEDGAVTLAGEKTKASIEQYPVGGIIYFSDNLADADQTKTMISNSQSYAKTPMFICVDEEGGSVARVAEKLGTNKFKNMFEYRSEGENIAQNNAKMIAEDIKQFGFNLDFAPVADVFSNPEHDLFAERAYSDNAEQASKLVAAAVKGFNDGGIIPVLKHFPGHGDTAEDSHEGTATLNKTLEELRACELLPFKSGIGAGPGMVMVGHITVPSIDPDKPATLSGKIVPELLRKELGYDGVVITDSMSMGAITDNYGYADIVKGIFDADIDMILCPTSLDEYISAIEAALKDGSITKGQLDAKVERILKLKYERGIIK